MDALPLSEGPRKRGHSLLCARKQTVGLVVMLKMTKKRGSNMR